MRSPLSHWRELTVLESVLGVLGWDEQVLMPQEAQPWRGEQSSLLARLIHERLTDPWLLEAVQGLNARDAGETELANFREMKRRIDRARRIPSRLVEEMARATSRGIHVWQEAKQKSDFGLFLPELKTIFRLKREEADCVGWTDSPYNALLDEYEPGCTTTAVDQIFRGLEPELARLVREKQTEENPSFPGGPYPVEIQKELGWKAALAFGFDEKAGRLDVSSHPFCSTLGPRDCRITTRYQTTDFTQSFFGILHETGHALYEQGLPQDHAGQPWCIAASLGMHESQSRFWENQIGRAPAFWDWFWPKTEQAFGSALGGLKKADFLRIIHQVRPGLIRVDADETSYNLHILVRYHLEKAMLDGSLAPEDLPSAWNEKIHKSLGITVPSDRFGCLQDVHWSTGGIGYFPTYTIGNLLAARWAETIQQELGDWNQALRQGDFGALLSWLRKNIHQQGRKVWALDLCQKVTGKPLDHLALIRHLESKPG